MVEHTHEFRFEIDSSDGLVCTKCGLEMSGEEIERLINAIYQDEALRKRLAI